MIFRFHNHGNILGLHAEYFLQRGSVLWFRIAGGFARGMVRRFRLDVVVNNVMRFVVDGVMDFMMDRVMNFMMVAVH